MARAYEHWQEFYHDVGLMCRNAMVYNEDGSAVFRDAQQISVSTSYAFPESHQLTLRRYWNHIDRRFKKRLRNPPRRSESSL